MPVALPVHFTPAAQAEVTEAQDWYEAQEPGLGGGFRAELGRAVQRLAANPLQFLVVFRDVRRAGHPNIAAALRTYAARPAGAVALLLSSGLT